jgi:hypothetical protein
MPFITYSDVTEVRRHEMVTEASSLGLRPGYFPQQFSTNIGNGLNFIFSHQEAVGGELIAIHYEQANGCVSLKVLND